jgi:hypothetical protein
MILYTIINIVITELLFYVAELFIKHNKLSCIVTLILGLYVMSTSFGGNVATLVITITENNGTIEFITILLFFANMFYGYMRGLRRIQVINKKYGNL